MEVNWDRKREGTWSQHWSLEKTDKLLRQRIGPHNKKETLDAQGLERHNHPKFVSELSSTPNKVQRSNKLKQSKSLKGICYT